MGKVNPTGQEGESHYREISTATLQKMRVGYNTHTKSFSPMGVTNTAKIDHMVDVEKTVAQLPIPTDFTSPGFLSTVTSKTTAKGTSLKSDTKDVAKFFSGEAALFPRFISSVSEAQNQI